MYVYGFSSFPRVLSKVDIFFWHWAVLESLYLQSVFATFLGGTGRDMFYKAIVFLGAPSYEWSKTCQNPLKVLYIIPRARNS